MTEDPLAIFHASITAEPPLLKYREGPHRRAVADGLLIQAIGLGPDPNLWYAVVYTSLAPEHFFARAAAFFDDDHPYSVTVEVGQADALEAALRRRGWHLDEEEPALVLAPIPRHIPPAPDGLSISPVKDEAGYEAFFSIAKTRYVPSLAAATDPAVALLVGSVGGAPVATSRLGVLGAIADITTVVTMPEHRKRGYGTAMTWAAIAEGARRGCASAVLTATEMGYPVYVRMGFQPVAVYRTYLPPT